MTQRPRILVCRFGAMGDILFTTPALRALRAAHPRACITYLLLDKWRFLLKRNPNVDRVAPLAFREPKALGKLRRERFDLIVNWNEGTDGARLLRALEAEERRGHDWDGERLVRAEGEGALLGADRESLRRLAASGVSYPELYARIAGVRPDSLAYDFDPGPWARARARRILRRTGCGGGGAAPVALHVHSRGAPSKHWRAESVASFVRLLPERRFLVLGYRPDRAATDPLAAEPNVAVVYADAATQGALLAHCALFVGIDSGPRQLAAAAGVPAVCLFGPRPAQLLPAFPGDQAIELEAPCAPCFDPDCGLGLYCMGRISPERIAQAAREALGESTAPGAGAAPQ